MVYQAYAEAIIRERMREAAELRRLRQAEAANERAEAPRSDLFGQLARRLLARPCSTRGAHSASAR